MYLKSALSDLWLPVTCKSKPWRPTNSSPVIVINNFVWNPSREEFIDIGDANYDEIFAALGITHLVGFGVGSSSNPLTPVTRDYNSGSGTETSPTGDGFVVVESVGGGGGGGCRNNAAGGGGGGGAAYCMDNSRSITTGATCSYSVGAAGTGDTNTGTLGDGTNGGNSNINTGTNGFSGINQSAGGGDASTGSAPGSGGSASGGTSLNIDGDPGSEGPIGPGGSSGSNIGTGNRGYGGAGGDASGSAGQSGIAGRIRFTYTA